MRHATVPGARIDRVLSQMARTKPTFKSHSQIYYDLHKAS